MNDSSMQAEPRPGVARTPSPPPRRRRWWTSGRFWIGVLGTVLGAAGTLAVNEAVARAFPGTDRAGRLADAVRGLAEEMRVNRDGVARLTEQLRDADPGSPRAAEIAVRLEASATALVRTSDRLSARVAALAGDAHATPAPSAVPAPRSADPAPAAAPAVRSPSEIADSAPEPDLWLPTHQSTLIGTSRNAFGVQFWGEGINITRDKVMVALNGQQEWLRAGDRMQYPDPAQDCFVVYLRTHDPDPAREGDERHGFALTCGPKAAPGT